MNTKWIRSLGVLAAPFILAGVLAPQAPAGTMQLSTMTYQGRLKESGLPVTGARSVQINLCDAPAAGSCQSSPWQNVSVANGLFRTTFSISGADLSAKPWYLEVQVGPSGGAPTTTLSPRELLTASPYAIYSSSGAFAVLASSATTLIADSSSGGAVVSTNLFVVNGSSVGIGAMNPGIALSLGNSADRAVGLETSATGNGSTMTVQAGDAFTGAFTGGNLVLRAGSGSNGGGAIRLVPGQSAGTQGYVEVSGGSSSAHLRATQSAPPTISVLGACGAGSSVSVTANSTDMAGSITITTGAGVAAGCGARVTFARSYSFVPKMVIITSGIPQGGMSQGYVTAPAATYFDLLMNNPFNPYAYLWYYMVIE